MLFVLLDPLTTLISAEKEMHSTLVDAVQRTMHDTCTLLHSIIEVLRHLPDVKMSVSHNNIITDLESNIIV